jgi:hypothetical protein
MRYRNVSHLGPSQVLVTTGVPALVIMIIMNATVLSDVRQDKNEQKTLAAQTQINSNKKPARKEKSESIEFADDNIARVPNNGPNTSPAEKEKLALSLIDGALAGIDKINPVEYSILVQVEAATLLWRLDKERSISLLKSGVMSLRKLREEERESKEKQIVSKRRQTLRSLAMRKVAALKPDLLKNLSADYSSEDKTAQAVSAEWSQEAKALIAVASDEIAKKPKLAAQLAEQALPLGMVDWAGFLSNLSQRDAGEAEKLAATIINRMRGSLVHPSAIYDLKRFVMASERPQELKRLFLQSLAAQLRLNIRPDKTAHELTGYFYTAREMQSIAGADFPNWQAEFADIASTVGAIFTERLLAIPGPPIRRIVDPSLMNEVKPGDTQEISKGLPRVEAMIDSKARDRGYQQLAAQAGIRTDFSLAESIISRIEDDAIRIETTAMVYRPMVRKAMSESNWSYAQRLALNVQDPLGRTLLLDQIAQAMAQAHEDKSQVMDVYRLAIGRVQREESTQKVGKAFLLLAKSLLPIDHDAGLDAANSAISVLNKIAKEDDPLEEAPLGEAVSSSVNLPNSFLNSEDVLVLPELLGNVLKDIAKRNADESVMIADGLAHRGLYSLARLAISKALLEASNSPDAVRRKQAATKP